MPSFVRYVCGKIWRGVSHGYRVPPVRIFLHTWWHRDAISTTMRAIDDDRLLLLLFVFGRRCRGKYPASGWRQKLKSHTHGRTYVRLLPYDEIGTCVPIQRIFTRPPHFESPCPRTAPLSGLCGPKKDTPSIQPSGGNATLYSKNVSSLVQYGAFAPPPHTFGLSIFCTIRLNASLWVSRTGLFW